jgi:glycosyltransferase involved in cell wall biosynthesis
MSTVVSVIVPTYRRPHLLKVCLEALLLQRFDKNSYEIIVVSDGPDDETQNVLRQWAPYTYPALRYLSLPQKKGPAAARNYGWLSARGSIIAFTDDDCIPDSHWLDEIAKNGLLHEHMAITGHVIVPVSKPPTDYELNTVNLQTADFITANCACTKKALQKAGGFDEKFSMAWREDSDLHFKLIGSGIPIKEVYSAIVIHPVRKTHWGVSIKEQKKTMFDALLYKKYPAMFREKIRPKSPVLYYAIIIAFITMLAGLLLSNNQVAAISFCIWGTLTLFFVYKRLAATKISAGHVIEILITSIVIPFASVYWQWFGAIKYKVLFI